MRPKTITSEYLDLQRKLHQRADYGIASLSFAPVIAAVMSQHGLTSLSDYGAGKKNLLRGLHDIGVHPSEYFPYDPAFPEYGDPKPADLVCCIDVLEHIEPSQLTNVLSELCSITTGLGFFSIHMGPAEKVLADGRNAHLIQKPSSWWLPRIARYFEVVELQSHELAGSGIWLLVKPKIPSPSMKQRFRNWLITARYPNYTPS
jgi:hypothetical protein